MTGQALEGETHSVTYAVKGTRNRCHPVHLSKHVQCTFIVKLILRNLESWWKVGFHRKLRDRFASHIYLGKNTWRLVWSTSSLQSVMLLFQLQNLMWLDSSWHIFKWLGSSDKSWGLIHIFFILSSIYIHTQLYRTPRGQYRL